jgi:hypothetical protein
LGPHSHKKERTTFSARRNEGGAIWDLGSGIWDLKTSIAAN